MGIAVSATPHSLVALRAVALVVLASLGFAGPASSPRSLAGARVDVGAGVSVTYPGGWHPLRPRITAMVSPSERLLLTSYTTRRGGNCSPDRAERDLPARGALIYLFEYRPKVGAVWAQVRRRDFPSRPAHFALRRADLGDYECWRVPSYLIRFRAADRPFQIHVALGAHASTARRAQVLRILDSLRFTPLPAPPPDPYASWTSLSTETGDTLRTPPQWTAAPTTSPRRYARPRALFFASNLRLSGLPPRRPRTPSRLPAPWPTPALDAFPPDGVLLWVREEPEGPPSDAFPALRRGRRWPQASDFHAEQTGPARRWPALRGQRAAAERRRTRLSIRIISGPQAGDHDRGLAAKAAAALTVSVGPWRDTPCRRACRTG
jgi:hypothetical protein